MKFRQQMLTIKKNKNGNIKFKKIVGSNGYSIT